MDIQEAKFLSVALELEHSHRDGSTRVMETVFRGFRDRQGKLVGIYGHSRDISERKRMEENLRESEERYRDLIENSQDVICTHDLKGNLLSVGWSSRIAIKIQPYPPKNTVFTPFMSLIIVGNIRR